MIAISYIDLTQKYDSNLLISQSNWQGNLLPILYQKQPIYFQTPRLSICRMTPTSLTITFRDLDWNPVSQQFLDWLIMFEKHLSALNQQSQCHINEKHHKLYLKNNQYYLTLSLQATEIYDDTNQLITDLTKYQLNHVRQITALLEIPYLRRRSFDSPISYHITVLQVRCWTTLFPKGISLLTNQTNTLFHQQSDHPVAIKICPPSSTSGTSLIRPPPPPPPPPPRSKIPKGGMILPFLRDINQGQFQLNKVDKSVTTQLPRSTTMFQIDLKTLLETKGKLKPVDEFKK